MPFNIYLFIEPLDLLEEEEFPTIRNDFQGSQLPLLSPMRTILEQDKPFA